MPAREIANEKILHGLISLYILRELHAAPMHGYELGKKIASATGRPMPQGSIYVLLKSLKSRNFVTLDHVTNEKGQLLCRYHITEEGREFLRAHADPLKSARRIIDDLIISVDNMSLQDQTSYR